MVKTNIADGGGSKTEAFVKDNALLVTNYTSPPLLQQKTKIFVHKLTIDGTKGGVFDMRVDGSGTEVEFYIQAGENDRTPEIKLNGKRYITTGVTTDGRGDKSGV